MTVIPPELSTLPAPSDSNTSVASDGATTTTIRRRPRWTELVAKWGVLAGFLAMIVFFSIMRPDTFATWQNARTIINATPIVIIFGCIVTVAMICGEFDISFPYLA